MAFWALISFARAGERVRRLIFFPSHFVFKYRKGEWVVLFERDSVVLRASGFELILVLAVD